MYADRYGAGPRIKPGSMTLAMAATALPVLALIAGLQISHTTQIAKIFEGTSIRLDPPPPPDPKPITQPKEPTPAVETIYTPPITPPIVAPNPIKTTDILPPPTPPTPIVEPGVGNGGGVVIDPPKPPVMVNAEVDPKYRNLLQPPYPAEEQRAGNSGRVVVRVRIGTDGRVKEVNKVSAASDAFYAAAERQALTKWRFRPATKDGVAIEQWKTMSLSFVLNQDG